MGQNPLKTELIAETSSAALLDHYLHDQGQLTAVEKFAQQHADEKLPLQAKYYRELLPLERPRAGQQYAFEVNLDACTGCKSCVTACHSMNGLDAGETWRDVGQLVGGTSELPMLQMITAACHHCAHPACMDGCPVLAYEKNPFTGIVKHLDDQCIGCQYCILKCPYDVPKYSPARGIVRKCDMCSSRLEASEAPACVQACPSSAIRITVVDIAAAEVRAENGEFLPASPDPRYTVPTTVYKRAVPFPEGTRAANAATLRPAARHMPLVFMLVLTQMSVGLFAMAWARNVFHSGASAAESARVSALFAFGAAIFGLNTAFLHLGKPFLAFRAILGIRTSWMSKEIAVFGLFGACATTYTAHELIGLGSDDLALWVQALTVLAGIAGVFCSAMIYVDTRRAYWASARTMPLFALTTILLGLSGSLVVAEMAKSSTQRVTFAIAPAVIFVAVTKLALELSVLRPRQRASDRSSALANTATLLKTQLRSTLILRALAGIVGGVFLPILMQMRGPHVQAPELAFLSLMLLFGGELLERMLFFQAAAPTAMPGALGL